ncbi:MAG: hypothetical protein ACRD2I_10305 [Vicinamibacterales bacterium]
MSANLRLRLLATPTLSAVIAVLLLAYSRKIGVLNTGWLQDHKDALGALGSVASAVTFVVGGVLAYYRFFRGRTLATRAELAISVDIVQGPHASLLHAITVSIKNVGTVSIWNPVPALEITAHRDDGTTTSENVNGWHEVSDDSSKVSVLDSGESGDFFSQRFFTSDIWAVTYVVTVNCDSGDSWTKLKTVENRGTQKQVG